MAPPDRMRARLLQFLRVPVEPTAPVGAADSIKIFRAGRKYYLILLLIWGVAQITALGGILFSLAFIDQFEAGFRSPPSTTSKVIEPASLSPTTERPKRRPPKESTTEQLTRKIADWPSWTFPLIRWLEYGAIVIFIGQLPITIFLTRLEFEQHWYIVTDRSLRIRTGILRLKESTMSFANIQQVEVKQGPLQRLLGLADVRVQSAGGGTPDHHKGGESMHLGIFHGVDNPDEIRDLILSRLRHFRQAGLGDHDDTPQHKPDTPAVVGAESLSAAQELLAEVRELHGVLRG